MLILLTLYPPNPDDVVALKVQVSSFNVRGECRDRQEKELSGYEENSEIEEFIVFINLQKCFKCVCGEKKARGGI